MSRQGENNVDLDGLMMDWLYDELSPSDKVRFEREVAEHPERMADAQALARTRGLVSSLPEVEPPPSLSAILLQEAAKHAKPARAKTESRGFFAWFGALFQQMALHPGFAAAASLVLIAGVAGTLYVTRQVSEASDVSVSMSPSEGAEAPAAVTAEERASQPALGQPVELAKSEEAKPQPDPAAAEPAGTLGDLSSEDSEAPYSRAAEQEQGVRLGALLDSQKSKELAQKSRDSRLEAAGRSRSAASKAEPTKPKKDADNDKLGKLKVNAVSGGYLAKGSSESREDEGGATDDYAPPPPPNAPSRGGVLSKVDTTDAPIVAPNSATRKWSIAQRAKLPALAKKDCLSAARVANDILDRDPQYFNQAVRGAKDISACQWYVSNEASVRSRNRATAAKPTGSKAGGSSSGTAAPRKKARSAPAEQQANDAYSK